jgi:uroporphyrin-3 C-methyltransferase
MSSRGRKVTKDTKNIKAEKVVDKKAVEKQSAEQKTSAKQALDKKRLDKETSEKKPSPSPKAPNSSGSLWLKLLLTLIVVAGLVVAGWFGWTQWQQRVTAAENFGARLDSLDGSYVTIAQQSQKAEKRQSKDIEQVQRGLATIQLRLNNQGKRLAELGTTTRSDWLLAEAAYLARLANQRLQTERSTKNPLALLENVDVILKQLDDPELLPLRGAVAIDITALRLAGEVDASGLYLELNALAESIDQLVILKPSAEAAVIAKQPQTALEQPKLQGLITGFVDGISQLIRVTQRDQPIEPLLQANEEAIVRHNLRLMLEQAQSAVMREEQAIYSKSLDKAQRWLAQYFQLNPNAVIIQQRLASLSEQEIIQQLPDINGSLQAIETLIALRNSRLTNTDNDKSVTQ